MSDRRLFVLLVLILAAVSGAAAWAFLGYRAARQELAHREEATRAREAEQEARREAEFERQKVEQEARDRVAQEAAERLVAEQLALFPLSGDEDRNPFDYVAPPPREKGQPSPSQVAADREREDLLPKTRLTDPPLKLSLVEIEDKGDRKARARHFRWTLKFTFADTRDYARQLAACGAVVYLQTTDGTLLRYPDPTKPEKREAVKPDTIPAETFFYDSRRESVAEMARTLRYDRPVRGFATVFPDPFLTELDKKELAYRNRRPEDIQETTFEVRVGGDGKPEVRVVDQKGRR